MGAKFLARNGNKPYYVVIDGLDEGWVEDRVRYKLISVRRKNPQVVDSTGCNRLFLVAKIVQMSYSCGVISQGSTHFGTIFAIFATLTS